MDGGLILTKQRGSFVKRPRVDRYGFFDSGQTRFGPLDLDLTILVRSGGGAAALGCRRRGLRRRAAASSPELTEIGHPGSIQLGFWPGSELGLRGTRLGDRLVEW